MANLTILTPLQPQLQPISRADIGLGPVTQLPASPVVVPLSLSASDQLIVEAAKAGTIPASAYLLATPAAKTPAPAPKTSSSKVAVAGTAPRTIGSAARVKRVGSGYHVSGKLAVGQIKDMGPNKQAEQAYERMRSDAAVSGIVLTKVYSYRSIAEQKVLWRQSDRTGRWVARPGRSEHHTGLAFDINTTTSPFGQSPAYKWMKQHAWAYGFVQSMGHEPWHWRYDPEAVRKVVAKAKKK